MTLNASADDTFAAAEPWVWTWPVVVALATFAVALLFAEASLARSAATAVGAGLALGILLVPTLALPVMLFAVQTNLSHVASFHHGLPDLGPILALYILAAVAARILVLGERRAFRPSVLLPMTVFALAAAISLFHHSERALAEQALTDLAKDLLIATTVAVLLTDRRQLRAAVWSWIAAGGIIGALVTWQALSGDHSTFGGFAAAEVLHIAGEINKPRLSGPLPDPNYFAQTMVFVVPLALDRLLNAPRRIERLTAGVAFLVSTLAVFFSYSRGGLLALGVPAAVVAWRNRHSPILWLGLAVLGGVGAALMPPEAVERLSSAVAALDPNGPLQHRDEAAIEGRLDVMRAAVAIFLDHPILGVGVGNFEALSQQYALDLGHMVRGMDRSAHSLYLETAAEKGIVGVTSLLILLGAAVHSVLCTQRRLEQAGYTDAARMAKAIGIGLLAYLVAAIFLHDSFARFFWSYIAVILALPQVVDHDPPRGPTAFQSVSA